MDRWYLKIALLVAVLVYSALHWKTAVDWTDASLHHLNVGGYDLHSRVTAREGSENITEKANAIRQVLLSNESLEYMDLWNMRTDLNNYWLQVVSEMKKTSKNKTALDAINEGYAILTHEIETLMRKSLEQRKSSIEEMNRVVRRKIEALQNPQDCKSARFLICDVRKDCGFGCWLHIVLNCFLNAFRDERAVVYKQKNFRYESNPWGDIFLPLTNCTDGDYDGAKAGNSNPRVLLMTPEKATTATWIHWAIPFQFNDVLPRIHGDPFAWWIAQFTAYAMRLNRVTAEKLSEMKSEIAFTHPIVGIHVRRGDKTKSGSARRFEVEEYMFFVEQWYLKLAIRGKNVKRTVYVATDDATVLPELNRKYPKYKFISRPTTASKRYTVDGMHEIASEIHVLSKCDYLVCAQSSSVCRTAYELMAYVQADASITMQGLDIPYGFKQFPPKPYKIDISHSGPGAAERNLKPGNNFSIRRDPFQVVNEGYLSGEMENGRKIRIPAYKARAQLSLTNYSIFH